MSLHYFLPASKKHALLLFIPGIMFAALSIAAVPGHALAQCGGEILVERSCSYASEPVSYTCAPNELALNGGPYWCQDNGQWYQMTYNGYCQADASCTYSQGYYYGQGYYQGYYQSYYQGYYQGYYYGQGYYQGYYYGQGYYQGYYYGQGYYQGYYYGQGYYQSTYYAEGYYAPVCSGPTVAITATPSRVRVGNTVQLKVTASGITTSCTVTGPGVSQTLTPTSCNVGPTTITTPAITKQSTYTVSCDSAAATTKVIVNTIPRFFLF